MGTINTRYGQLTQIPAARPGGILYAMVHGGAVSRILERVRTILYRSKFRSTTINGASTYRLVPGTSSDGLLMDAPARIDYPAPFNLSPNIRTIKFTGPSGPLKLDLEWVPIRGA